MARNQATTSNQPIPARQQAGPPRQDENDPSNTARAQMVGGDELRTYPVVIEGLIFFIHFEGDL
jgi:hypothetical protein